MSMKTVFVGVLVAAAGAIVAHYAIKKMETA